MSIVTKNLRPLAISAAMVGVLFGGGVAHGQEATDLKIQSIWQAGSINQKVFERFAERVGEKSDGQLTITPLAVNAVVAHNETLDAVAAGILDGQHSASVYFSGRDAGFGMIGDLNGGYESADQMTGWFYEGGGLDLARELYAQYGLYYVGPVFWGMESIPMKKRVASLSDFEGVKLRMPEGPASDLFRKIGASPVNIPGAEVYTSLERGVIDGTDWGTLSMNDDLGFHKIAPYPIYPGLHSLPAGELVIGLDTWNGLSDEQKALLEAEVQALNRDMIDTLAAADQEVVAKYAGQDDVVLIDWSDEERKKLRVAASEVWADYAQRSEMAQKVYESHLAYLKKLGLLD